MKKFLLLTISISGLYATGDTHTPVKPLSNLGLFGSTSDTTIATSDEHFRTVEAQAKEKAAMVAGTEGESRFFRADQGTKNISIELKEKIEALEALRQQKDLCEALQQMTTNYEREISKLKEFSGKTKRIFNVCGGGAKGLIPAILATILEEYINLLEYNDTSSDESNNDQTPREPRPWRYLKEYFDVFSGTSTGSIVSAGLAFNDGETQYEAYKIAQIYFRHLPEVFTANSALLGGGTIKSKYDDTHLNDLLMHYFKNQTFDTAFKSNTCYVVATEETPSLIKFVFGDAPQCKSMGSVHVHDGCRASSAAPSYFTKKCIARRSFRDGGVIANDASETAKDRLKNTHKGFVEVYDFGCGVEAPASSSSVDALAALKILQDSITATQNESRERLFEIAKSQDGQVTYMSLIEPLLKHGMDLDSTSDLFIRDCFSVANEAAYSTQFLSILYQVCEAIDQDRLQSAIELAFKKIKSIEITTLQSLERTPKEQRVNQDVDFFKLYAARQLQNYNRAFLTENGLDIMENGVLRKITHDEFNNTLFPFLEKLNPTQTNLIKILRGTQHAQEYTNAEFREIMEQANYYRYKNSSSALIPQFKDRPTGGTQKSLGSAGERALAGVAVAPVSFCKGLTSVVSAPIEAVCSAIGAVGATVNYISQSRAKRLESDCTDMPEQLDHFANFLLAYYKTLDALQITTHDDKNIEWITEAILNKMFKVEFYSLEDIELLIHACQLVADDLNPNSSTRLDTLIATLKKKCSIGGDETPLAATTEATSD